MLAQTEHDHKKLRKKLHATAKTARICKLVKVVQKLRCTRLQLSDGTNWLNFHFEIGVRKLMAAISSKIKL